MSLVSGLTFGGGHNSTQDMMGSMVDRCLGRMVSSVLLLGCGPGIVPADGYGGLKVLAKLRQTN